MLPIKLVYPSVGSAVSPAAAVSFYPEVFRTPPGKVRVYDAFGVYHDDGAAHLIALEIYDTATGQPYPVKESTSLVAAQKGCLDRRIILTSGMYLGARSVDALAAGKFLYLTGLWREYAIEESVDYLP